MCRVASSEQAQYQMYTFWKEVLFFLFVFLLSANGSLGIHLNMQMSSQLCLVTLQPGKLAAVSQDCDCISMFPSSSGSECDTNGHSILMVNLRAANRLPKNRQLWRVENDGKGGGV